VRCRIWLVGRCDYVTGTGCCFATIRCGHVDSLLGAFTCRHSTFSTLIPPRKPIPKSLGSCGRSFRDHVGTTTRHVTANVTGAPGHSFGRSIPIGYLAWEVQLLPWTTGSTK